jgi:NADH-quinone oxidoreductase subunit L
MNNPQTVDFIRWIIVLPLAGAVFNFLFGATLQKKIGRFPISVAGCGVIVASFVLALIAFLWMLAAAPDRRFWLDDLWRWFDIGGLRLDVAFWLDPLSMVMVLIVTGVGGLIHLYSTGYMREDPSYWRFFGWLNLFTFAMLTLVLADNLWLMFVGWEGVGLCSFALIGFWYAENVNTSAGNKAFIFNRVGDWAFVLALYSLFSALAATGHPTLVIREIARYAPMLAGHRAYAGMSLLTFVTLLLFFGATGKSAQIPLFAWLPDAMAGPTPVSALIHAATMVTAGIYMIARLNFLFSMAPITMLVVATVGAVTALFAATIGVTQTDIKRVLAYSTISQLGYMFVGVGIGAYTAGIFHLMTHAFFKACLFLGAGSVIHAMGGEQDMRRMGGLRDRLPITFWTFLAATLAICGIPPFAGFMSKDEIIWRAFDRGHPWLWFLLWVSAGVTAFYMFRQLYMTFFGEFRGTHQREHHLHEAPPSMSSVLMVLGLLSLVGGAVMLPRFIIEFSPLEVFLAPVFDSPQTLAIAARSQYQGLEGYFAALSLGAVAAGWFLADLTYRLRILSAERMSQFLAGIPYTLSFHKYYVDELYDYALVRPYTMATRAAGWFDQHIIDGLVNLAAVFTVFGSWLSGLFDNYVVDGLVNLAADATLAAGGRLRRLQTGSINGYLYGLLAAVTVILIVQAVLRT